MDQDLDRIADSLEPVNLDWLSLVFAAAILVGTIVLARIARRSIRALANRVDLGSPGLFASAARITSWVVISSGVVASLRVLGIDFVPLLAGLGVLAVVLAVALQPFLENFAAGLTIQLQRPLELGDEIQVAGTEGRVVEQTARSVVLKTNDGTTVHLPNRKVLGDAIVNLTVDGQRRTTMDVGLAYGTDLAIAASVIEAAVMGSQGVSSDPPPEALVHEFGDSTINTAVRYWHDPTIRSGWTTRHEVAVSIKRALDANGIEIAFPQRVLWQGEVGSPDPLDK